ncbi:hypothetical protein SERLADRAFT_460293 [Serpula lacrymans var. lacrymans S7.9]|uniref:Uncharacterized protein n=1 Tax=Serpula lacrymans var. lacrymans (strain S7.9) TaxID=578457 RepID=F8NPT2_SERL9|nr:uncharacterized protein SERLADRAFT_460293 [Serpula lacrymans var. lacrymans S7.9]EGO27238.1 hypothetical protein SERLADRAFT_460293 [Serpula lacrymans var. lacrymans S7.9]
MAAIAEDDGEADAEGEEDTDILHVSEVENAHDSNVDVSMNQNDDGTRAVDMDEHDHTTDSIDDPRSRSNALHTEDHDHVEVGQSEVTVPYTLGVEPLSPAVADKQGEGTAAVVPSEEEEVIIITGGVETQLVDNNIVHSGSSTVVADLTSIASSSASSLSTSTSTPVTSSNVPHGGKQSADDVGYSESQVAHQSPSGSKPLVPSASIASTVADTETQEGHNPTQEGSSTQPDESDDKGDGPEEADSMEQEHLPEPPASPASNTLLSTSSSSTYGDPSQSQSIAITKSGKTPSANRLSISYAAGSRRLVVDAEVVDHLKVFRSDGRIEVHISVEKDDADGLKGILIEGLSDTTKSYLPLQTLSDASESDKTIPTFSKAAIPSKISLTVHLDTDRPLSEPKWVKSGDVQEWLKSMFGRMFWVAGDAADGWEKKIEVVDPDPAPTIWTVLDGWAVNSPVGLQTERQRFLKTHMTETDNLLEILLRLVRGERATPFSQSAPTISAPSVSGPLLSALSQGSAHGAQQTHVSLAVLAMFRMCVDYAEKASGQKGKVEAEEKMSEIVRCLPSHLIYKSLDGIFKEWRVEKKGGR